MSEQGPQRPETPVLKLDVPAHHIQLGKFLKLRTEQHRQREEAIGPVGEIPVEEREEATIDYVIYVITDLLKQEELPEIKSEKRKHKPLFNNGRFSFDFTLTPEELEALKRLILDIVTHYLMEYENAHHLTVVQLKEALEQVVDLIKVHHPTLKVQGTREALRAAFAEKRRQERLETADKLVALSAIQEKNEDFKLALSSLLRALSLNSELLETLAPILKRLSSQLINMGDETRKKFESDISRQSRNDLILLGLGHLVSPPPLRLINSPKKEED